MISRIPPNVPDARLLPRTAPPEPLLDGPFGPLVMPSPSRLDEADCDGAGGAGAGTGDTQNARVFNRDGFFGGASPHPPVSREAPPCPGAGEAEGGVPAEAVASAPPEPGPRDEVPIQRPLPGKRSAPFAGQTPTFEHPIAWARIVPEAFTPLPTVAANPEPPSPATNQAELLETLAASLADPPVQPGANTNFALTLSSGGAGVDVAVRAAGLEPEERERLERRIAGELARHGLIINTIVLTAPPVEPDQD